MSELPKVRLPVLQAGAPASREVPLALTDLAFLPPDVPAFDHAAIRTSEPRALRTSSYAIWVDLPDSDDEMLLIHGYTGAYDKVSRRVVAYLRALDGGKRHKPLHGSWSPEPGAPGASGSPGHAGAAGHVVTPSDATIQKLKKRGYLTQMSVEEEESFFTKAAAGRHLRAVHRAPNYILIPTYECNLRCPYCFQDHMRTDPSYRHLLRTMQPEMVDRLLKGMRGIEAAHGIPADAELTRNITFFGGEPLLAQSRPVIGYIIDRLLGMGKAKLSAVTNGTDLDVYEDLLGPEKISYLQLTIDGPPAMHDQRRIYADGSGSFERIARNIDLALSLGVKMSVRMNIDRSNIHLLPEIGEEFRARGWIGRAGFSTYVAPVHASNDQTSAKTTFNSWELNRALAALQDTHPTVRPIGGPDDGLVERVRRIFDQRSDPAPSFKSDFCGAHTSMYILDPFGDIYACWERTGDPSIRIGSITEAGEVLMNRAVLEAWRGRSVTSNPVCRRCRFASYCGGGCAVLAEGKTGTIHSNHCDGFAKRFRHSAALAYAEHVSGAVPARDTDRVCDL
ncbi:MAG TPA: radical SAM protein [Kofleriaceae bacterium]